MLMLALEWMGMHNDDTIHHMRVGKQRNPSQIGNEQQREDILHYILQLRQDFPIKLMREDNGIYNKKTEIFRKSCIMRREGLKSAN